MISTELAFLYAELTKALRLSISCLTGTGMGPVYPAIQHMAPANFGRKNSAAVIGLQMASAYIGSTFMPMVFGHLQEAVGIGIMPVYLTAFAVLNIGLLEFAYKRIASKADGTD